MKQTENNDTIVDTSTLTQDDLQDAYEKLAKKYSEIKESNDNLNQKLHQVISHNKVLENTLNDVQNELDSINEVNSKELSQLAKKNEELRIKNQTLIMEKIVLENKIDDLSAMINQLNKEVKEVRGLLAVKAIKPRVSDTLAKSLEIENENLRSTINEMKKQAEELTIKYSISVNKAAELTERLECVQDNLDSKKVELEEKIESMEHLHERMHELSTEVTLLRNSAVNDDNNRKGNSLFAEVDDQRQKMKKILQGERSHYLEMKKAFNSKEMEIRRLKRENLNIKSEIQACSNQLKRSEHMSSTHLKVYISNLEFEKKSLESQLKEMEERLKDLATDQKMNWIETVVTSSSREARELKDKHYVLLREKTSLADNHSKTLKELAKVRLDSIKLRTMLGRIVDEFKIKIDETQYDDLDIDEGIFENLKLQDYEPLNLSGYKEYNDDSNEMLNESTIILLGGRDKLGNAIPCIKESDLMRNQQLRSCDQNFGANKINDCAFGSRKDYKTYGNKGYGDVKAENLQSSASFQKPKSDGNPSNRMLSKDIKLEKVDVPVSNKENVASSNPIKVIRPKIEVKSLLRSKSIQFSDKVETRVIDSTKEAYEQSREARKKPAFTVTKITIPSRIPKTS